MCGIVGFTSKFKESKRLERMLDVQKYRGPDDSGICIEKIQDGFVHFGHNRLSIQDLSSHGHQPFISDCGSYIIVFNGEVYNFKAIRKELGEKGYTFLSQSDTEVILYAYKEWGVACLEKFIGMFAFAILDKVQNKLLLVRDRAGVKPLYYYDDNCFMFSSELKSFHEHPSFKKELNQEILPYYFQFGYIPSPHTIFKHTYKLNPGHYLEYDLNTQSYKNHEYWSIDRCYQQETFEKSEQEILDDLETLLSDAVELRMVSDVPVGVFLSGGYDSTLVTALLSQNKARKLHTFTIGFEDKRFNEAEHAKEIARYFGTDHTEHYVSQKEMLQKVESLPFIYDEPFGDSSAIPTMIVSELARKEVTVALSADGGDEVFCGYSKYFFLQKFEHIFSRSFQHRLLQSTLGLFSEDSAEQLNSLLPKKLRQTNIRDKYHKFKRAINAQTPQEMFFQASSYVEPAEVAKLMKTYRSDHLYEKFMMLEGQPFMDNMMRIDYKTFMVDDVLTTAIRSPNCRVYGTCSFKAQI